MGRKQSRYVFFLVDGGVAFVIIDVACLFVFQNEINISNNEVLSETNFAKLKCSGSS